MQIRYISNNPEILQNNFLNDIWSKLGFLKACYLHLQNLQKKYRLTDELTTNDKFDFSDIAEPSLLKLIAMPKLPRACVYQTSKNKKSCAAHYELIFFTKLYNAVVDACIDNTDINLFDLINASRFTRKELPVQNSDHHILGNEARELLSEFNIVIEPDSVNQLKHETDSELGKLQHYINTMHNDDVRKAPAQFVHDELQALQNRGLLVFNYRNEERKACTYDLVDAARLTLAVLKPEASELQKTEYRLMANRIQHDKVWRFLGKALASLFFTLLCAACIAAAVISFPSALAVASIILSGIAFLPGPLYLGISCTYFHKQNFNPLMLGGKMRAIVPETNLDDIVISGPLPRNQ